MVWYATYCWDARAACCSEGAARFTGAGPASSLTEHTGYLRLRGCPFTATKRDVLGFFRGHPVVEDSIEFVRRADGKMTGEVYVRLPSAEDAKRAMALDRSLMGRRYVELAGDVGFEPRLVRVLLRTENGGEFAGAVFRAFLAQEGTVPQYTSPYTPEQNGVAERSNRAIWDMVRTVIHHYSGAGSCWWGSCLLHFFACHG